VSGRIRRLYDFELEPEVRDRLDSLSDSDFKQADTPRSLISGPCLRATWWATRLP
jgi:hypothetical protein